MYLLNIHCKHSFQDYMKLQKMLVFIGQAVLKFILVQSTPTQTYTSDNSSFHVNGVGFVSCRRTFFSLLFWSFCFFFLFCFVCFFVFFCTKFYPLAGFNLFILLLLITATPGFAINVLLVKFRCFDTVFGRPYRCFSITLKVISSLSDKFTSDWLLIEVCLNAIFIVFILGCLKSSTSK